MGLTFNYQLKFSTDPELDRCTLYLSRFVSTTEEHICLETMVELLCIVKHLTPRWVICYSFAVLGILDAEVERSLTLPPSGC
jgi:hypothetical protein